MPVAVTVAIAGSTGRSGTCAGESHLVGVGVRLGGVVFVVVVDDHDGLGPTAT